MQTHGKKQPEQRLRVRIPRSVGLRPERLAERTGRSKSHYVREAIMEHLDDLEDLHLGAEVLERVRRGEESASGMEEVERRLSLKG